MPGRGTGRGALRRGAALALAGAAVCGVGAGLAQDGAPLPEVPPNPALTFDLGLGLQVDDETELRADLGAAYLARTRTQSVELSLGTSVRLGEDGMDGDGLLPRLDLGYGFDNGVSLLQLGGSYRVREVDGVVFAFEPDATEFDEVETIDDDGRLETVTLGADLALFRRDPVGLELGADVTRRTYRDTADPDLDDSRRRSLEAALRLTPRPGLDFRLTALRARDEDDGTLETETETARLGARVTWAATPATTIDLSLAHSEREERRNAFLVLGEVLVLTGGRETVRNDGLVWTGAISQARPNGSRSLGFSRELTDEGAISRLELGRALALAGGGDLSLGLGVAHFEAGDTVATLRLSYGRDLPQGARVTASASRTAGTDGDDQDVARTRVQLGYARPLTPVSDLSLTAGLARIDVLDGFEPDQSAVTLGVAYTRELTPDWSLSARYDRTAATQDGAGTERDDRLSLTLGRSFTFRP